MEEDGESEEERWGGMKVKKEGERKGWRRGGG